MSVFGPDGIAGAPLTEVKPGESWVANAPLVTDALVAQAIAEHRGKPDRWVERFDLAKPEPLSDAGHAAAYAITGHRDAQAFVGPLS